jgi:thiol-disulfide isomerase/thioredoxin
MKKLLCIFTTTLLLGSVHSSAQLADGATAPDFTFKDTKGVSHNLYTYLNQGKYIALDVFATWCGPCWDYHQKGSLDSLYEMYDAPGKDTWKVIQLEADGSTDATDLDGSGSATIGDWITNVHYVTIDPLQSDANLAKFEADYQIPGYPTLYLIGPNKKIYNNALYDYNQGADHPSVSDWEKTANKHFGFIPTGIDNFNDKNPLTIYPNPAKGSTNLFFNLNNSTNVKLDVTNTLGQIIDKKEFGRLSSGDQSIKYDLSNLQPGMYYFTLTAENSRSITKKLIVQ